MARMLCWFPKIRPRKTALFRSEDISVLDAERPLHGRIDIMGIKKKLFLLVLRNKEMEGKKQTF